MWIIDHTHTGYNIVANHWLSLLKTRKGQKDNIDMDFENNNEG